MDEMNNNLYESNETTAPSGTTGGSVSVQERAKDRAREMGSKINQHMERTREQTSTRLRSGSRGLESLSERLSDKMDIARERTFNGLKSTSQSMERLAGYLEERDTQAMVADTREVIRRHPGKSILAGLVLGLFVGRLFTR